MDPGRKELSVGEMEEIVAYDLDVSRTKACWFPFKKAYERSVIQSEFEDKPKVYVFEGHDDPFSKSFELSLGHNATGTSLPLEATSSIRTAGDLPFNRSELYDTETNSTVTEEEDLLFGEHAIHQLAEINPNCLSKQFWVEDLLDRKSLSCTDEFVSAGRSVTRLGRSFSTFGSHTTRQDIIGTKGEHADELSLGLSRAESPMTPARIEIEYDFSRKSPSSDPEIHPRSIKRVMCGVIQRKDKTRDHGAAHTMMSSMSNSTYSVGPTKGQSHSQSSGSAKSHVPNSQSSAINTEMKNEAASGPGGSASQKRATREVDFDSTKLAKHRILCGTMARRRQKGVPTDMGDDPSDEEKKNEESTLVHPTPSVHEPSLPSPSLDPPGQFCMRNPQFDAPWVSDMTSKLRAKTCAATNLDWDENRISSVDDTVEPHFYVEVEASTKRLNTVKDLDEIKNQEAVAKAKAPRAVERARVASLVDDDSAFMERERLVDVLKRLAAKRPSSMKNELPDQARSKERKVAPAKPLVASSFTPPRRVRKVRTGVSEPAETVKEQAIGYIDHNLRLSMKPTHAPPLSFQHVNSIVSQGQHHVPGYREGKEKLEDRWIQQNMSESSFDANDAPIEQTLVQTKSSAGAADRRWPMGSGHPGSARIPNASRSFDSRRTTSSNGSGHIVPRERIAVTEYPDEPGNSLQQTSDVNIAKATDSGGTGGFKLDFEIARFPSLTSSAWQNAERQEVEITSQLSEGSSFRAEQIRHNVHENYYAPISSNHDLMKHSSSKRTNSREDWAHFNSDEENESLRKSFLEAVPYAVEYAKSPDPESLVDMDHRGTRRGAPRSNAAVEKPVKTWNRGPAKIWIDDDESELNTEAFQKLSMDSDDDSIFNGLMERSPSDGAANTGEREGPPRVITPRKGSLEVEEDSVSSGHSIEQSRSTTGRPIYPTQSSRQLTRVQTGLSGVSRDEITAYTAAQSVFDEPFNCMDSWLDQRIVDSGTFAQRRTLYSD